MTKKYLSNQMLCDPGKPREKALHDAITEITERTGESRGEVMKQILIPLLVDKKKKQGGSNGNGNNNQD